MRDRTTRPTLVPAAILLALPDVRQGLTFDPLQHVHHVDGHEH